MNGSRSEWVLDIVMGSDTFVYQHDPEANGVTLVHKAKIRICRHERELTVRRNESVSWYEHFEFRLGT